MAQVVDISIAAVAPVMGATTFPPAVYPPTAAMLVLASVTAGGRYAGPSTEKDGSADSNERSIRHTPAPACAGVRS